MTGCLAADFEGADTVLATGLPLALRTTLGAALGAALATGLELGFATTGLTLDFAGADTFLGLDLAVGLTAVFDLGDAAAMIFFVPTDRVMCLCSFLCGMCA